MVFVKKKPNSLILIVFIAQADSDRDDGVNSDKVVALFAGDSIGEEFFCSWAVVVFR